MNQPKEVKPSVQHPTKKVKHVTLSAGGESFTGTGRTSTSIFSQSVTSAELSEYSDPAAGIVKPSGPPDDFLSNSRSRYEVFTYDEKMSQTEDEDDLSEDSDDTQLKIWWTRLKRKFELKSMCVGIGLTQMLAGLIHIFVRSVILIHRHRQMNTIRLLDILDFVIFTSMLLIGSVLLGAAYQMQEWLAMAHSLVSFMLAAGLAAIVGIYNTKNAVSNLDPKSRLGPTNSVFYGLEAAIHIPFAVCSAALYFNFFKSKKNKPKSANF